MNVKYFDLFVLLYVEIIFQIIGSRFIIKTISTISSYFLKCV